MNKLLDAMQLLAISQQCSTLAYEMFEAVYEELEAKEVEKP